MVLAASGLVAGPLVAAPIAVALVAVVLLAPAGRVPDLSIAATDDEVRIREAFERMMIDLRFKAADDLIDEVKRVKASILLTLEVEAGRVAGDPTVHLIRQTALDYLPTALAAYLKLPRVEAEQRAVAHGLQCQGNERNSSACDGKMPRFQIVQNHPILVRRERALRAVWHRLSILQNTQRGAIA